MIAALAKRRRDDYEEGEGAKRDILLDAGGTMTMNSPSRDAVFKLLIAALTAALTLVIGHALGYERALARVDKVSDRVTTIEKELIDIRASARQLSGDVDRDRQATERALNKIDSRLNEIQVDLRKLR